MATNPDVKILSITPAIHPEHYAIRFTWHRGNIQANKIASGDAIYDRASDEVEIVLTFPEGSESSRGLIESLSEQVRSILSREREKRPLCLLKVDIAGHSAISERYQQAEAEQTWDAFADLVEQEVQQRSGFVQSWQGDGGLCAFHGTDSEARAVTCANAILDGLGEFNGDENRNRLLVERIRVKMAVHTGWAKPHLNPGRIHSRDINFVAHLEASSVPARVILGG